MARGTEWGTPEVTRRKPVGTAPHAYQMKANPSSYKVGGYIEPMSNSPDKGGAMNGGGKRRPGSRTVR